MYLLCDCNSLVTDYNRRHCMECVFAACKNRYGGAADRKEAHQRTMAPGY